MIQFLRFLEFFLLRQSFLRLLVHLLLGLLLLLLVLVEWGFDLPNQDSWPSNQILWMVLFCTVRRVQLQPHLSKMPRLTRGTRKSEHSGKTFCDLMCWLSFIFFLGIILGDHLEIIWFLGQLGTYRLMGWSLEKYDIPPAKIQDFHHQLFLAD